MAINIFITTNCTFWQMLKASKSFRLKHDANSVKQFVPLESEPSLPYSTSVCGVTVDNTEPLCTNTTRTWLSHSFKFAIFRVMKA